MKLLVFNIFLLLVSACSYSENKQVVISSPFEDITVEQAIANAIASKDFRLYATSGRRITLPGIAESEFTALKTQCGVKFTEGTGDVIRSASQREQRTQVVHYMTSFNVLMKALCLQQK